MIQSYLNGLKPTVFIFEGPHIKRIGKTHKAVQSRKIVILRTKWDISGLIFAFAYCSYTGMSYNVQK